MKDNRMPGIDDKLDHLDQLHDDFEKNLEADADMLLGRYKQLDDKRVNVFARRNVALDARDKKFDEMDARLDRVSNLGNSPRSTASSPAPVSARPAESAPLPDAKAG